MKVQSISEQCPHMTYQERMRAIMMLTADLFNVRMDDATASNVQQRTRAHEFQCLALVPKEAA